jgi:hypothetical protein
MNYPNGNQWSKSLREETRRSISEMRIGTPDGRLYFKNSDGRRAFMSIQDLINEDVQLTDNENGTRIIFQSVAELIDAGWVID